MTEVLYRSIFTANQHNHVELVRALMKHDKEADFIYYEDPIYKMTSLHMACAQKDSGPLFHGN